MTEPLSLRIEIDDKKIVVQLNQEQGNEIRDMIMERQLQTLPYYAQAVGVRPSNFYAILKGTRPCTLDALNKILSGIGYEAKLSSPEILIQEVQTGQIVPDVDSILHDGELQLNEQEGQEE